MNVGSYFTHQKNKVTSEILQSQQPRGQDQERREQIDCTTLNPQMYCKGTAGARRRFRRGVKGLKSTLKYGGRAERKLKREDSTL